MFTLPHNHGNGDSGTNPVTPPATNTILNVHTGTLVVGITVSESYRRHGSGSFVGTHGLVGTMIEDGDTHFSVGPNLNSSVDILGKWQLDSLSQTSLDFTHVMSKVETTMNWTVDTDVWPYESFTGEDKKLDVSDHTNLEMAIEKGASVAAKKGTS